MAERNNNDIRYKIVERIGVIQEYQNGWRKEINRVSWNEGEPKYDIRDWSNDHTKMSRGITLSERDMKTMRALLGQRDMQLAANYQSRQKSDREMER